LLTGGPQVAVAGLRDRIGQAVGHPVVCREVGLGVLRDSPVCVERKGVPCRRQLDRDPEANCPCSHHDVPELREYPRRSPGSTTWDVSHCHRMCARRRGRRGTPRSPRFAGTGRRYWALSTTISTRRFIARPSTVLLSAIGLVDPKPTAVIAGAATPRT